MKLTTENKNWAKVFGIMALLFLISNVILYKAGELRNFYESPNFTLIILFFVLFIVLGLMCMWGNAK